MPVSYKQQRCIMCFWSRDLSCIRITTLMFIHMETVYVWMRQSRVCRVTIKNESIKIKLIKLNSDNNYAIHFRNNSECDEREGEKMNEKNRRLLTENVKNTRKKWFVAKTIENVVNCIWETAMLLSTLLVYFFLLLSTDLVIRTEVSDSKSQQSLLNGIWHTVRVKKDSRQFLKLNVINEKK